MTAKQCLNVERPGIRLNNFSFKHSIDLELYEIEELDQQRLAEITQEMIELFCRNPHPVAPVLTYESVKILKQNLALHYLIKAMDDKISILVRVLKKAARTNNCEPFDETTLEQIFYSMGLGEDSPKKPVLKVIK